MKSILEHYESVYLKRIFLINLNFLVNTINFPNIVKWYANICNLNASNICISRFLTQSCTLTNDTLLLLLETPFVIISLWLLLNEIDLQLCIPLKGLVMLVGLFVFNLTDFPLLYSLEQSSIKIILFFSIKITYYETF